MLPMDGRITQARFDSLVALIAGEKTKAEADRKAALQAAVRDRNGDSVRTDSRKKRVCGAVTWLQGVAIVLRNSH